MDKSFFEGHTFNNLKKPDPGTYNNLQKHKSGKCRFQNIVI